MLNLGDRVRRATVQREFPDNPVIGTIECIDTVQGIAWVKYDGDKKGGSILYLDCLKLA